MNLLSFEKEYYAQSMTILLSAFLGGIVSMAMFELNDNFSWSGLIGFLIIIIFMGTLWIPYQLKKFKESYQPN